jgi:serine/threonine-protein kinase
MVECGRCGTDHERGSEDCPAQRVGATVAGKYQILELVGVGAMGAVFKARHLMLGSRVALKILHPGYAEQPSATQRFYREAREAAALRHPGIVAVRDLGQDEAGCLYMEMELLEGNTLQTLVKGGPLPVELAVDVTIETLDALGAAHARQLVHRDLKPGNLFLALRPKRVVILDFGIAKAEDGMQLTNPDEAFGTPPYMSPEQVRSAKDVDHRTDLYALGATLFELLTARAPVEGKGPAAMFLKIVRGEVERRPRAHNPSVPAWLDEAVERAMAPDPAARFQSAREMRVALERGRASWRR